MTSCDVTKETNDRNFLKVTHLDSQNKILLIPMYVPIEYLNQKKGLLKYA